MLSPALEECEVSPGGTDVVDDVLFCYRVHLEEMTWFEASTVCWDAGGVLAPVEDFVTHQTISSYLYANHRVSVWIGYSNYVWEDSQGTDVLHSNVYILRKHSTDNSRKKTPYYSDEHRIHIYLVFILQHF